MQIYSFLPPWKEILWEVDCLTKVAEKRSRSMLEPCIYTLMQSTYTYKKRVDFSLFHFKLLVYSLI